MDRFEGLPSPSESEVSTALQIYNTFVHLQSQREVILPDVIRCALDDVFGKDLEIPSVERKVFGEAKEYVYITLRDDDLIRYVNSDVKNKAYYETPQE